MDDFGKITLPSRQLFQLFDSIPISLASEADWGRWGRNVFFLWTSLLGSIQVQIQNNIYINCSVCHGLYKILMTFFPNKSREKCPQKSGIFSWTSNQKKSLIYLVDTWYEIKSCEIYFWIRLEIWTVHSLEEKRRFGLSDLKQPRRLKNLVSNERAQKVVYWIVLFFQNHPRLRSYKAFCQFFMLTFASPCTATFLCPVLYSSCPWSSSRMAL